MRFLFIAALVLSFSSLLCFRNEARKVCTKKYFRPFLAGEQPEERDDCLGWFRGCDPNNDKCCEGYVCN
uniref:Kappa-Theraphotoxin-Sfo1g_1 n=1 Tax=Selenotholus foelschei TaxID=1905327 RepID=A0A482ZIJ0_9ARAC